MKLLPDKESKLSQNRSTSSHRSSLSFSSPGQNRTDPRTFHDPLEVSLSPWPAVNRVEKVLECSNLDPSNHNLAVVHL